MTVRRSRPGFAVAIACLVAVASVPITPPAARSAEPPPPARAAGAALGLAPDEITAILSHGPWPPPFVRDASNRASGDPAAIELGRRLFAERRLSPDTRRSCAGCHRADLGFADGRARSLGADGRPLDRNAPTLLDVRHHRWFGWDGGADSLWAFVLRPLTDPREVGADETRIDALLGGDAGLACLFRAVFGDADRRDPQATRVAVAKALAAYVETLESPRTRFDAFRDALARGDVGAARTYPADALRGLRRFVGADRCALCHLGPTFTHGEFHDAGRPYRIAPGRVDPGRHGGVRAVRADPYNRLGRWSDATDPDDAIATRHVVAEHRHFGEFRVPGLRALAATAPYGHDGSMATLRDVVRHYSTLDTERLHADGEALLRPLRLDAAATRDLLAFLATLSEPERGARPRPAQPPAAPPCPTPRRGATRQR